jgi:hypothetical protein
MVKANEFELIILCFSKIFQGNNFMQVVPKQCYLCSFLICRSEGNIEIKLSFPMVISIDVFLVVNEIYWQFNAKGCGDKE